MLRKNLPLAIVIVWHLTPILLQAQNLYMFRNIREAYTMGTRAFDGRPGPRYWQNHASYSIDVDIDLPTREVRGSVAIRYFNESPDTLKMIRLKLAHDLWRKNGQRAYELAARDINDGVNVRAVRVRNSAVEKFNQANTFLDIPLEQALPPGQAIDLGIDWTHQAPAAPGTPRECVCDSTTWFAAYWYPQVAVYDDLHGWADMPYNGMQEMYNDFSDYEVRITVPGNVMVWATGVWQNPEAMLASEYLNRYKKALASNEVVKIFAPEDYARRAAFFKNQEKHTFVYKAEGVPDFAFGFSDHYLWDARSALVNPATGRTALASAAYNPDSKDYYEVCEVAAKGLETMSTFLPGYPYPYPRMTVFNGDDGMEFPMMCNDASTHPQSPVTLTIHEMSHTYFPFMMGINEQYYAWMDEGWAAFFDVMVSDTVAGASLGRLRNYWDHAGTDMDMPPITPSRQLSSGYRVASYNRPQAAYLNLYQMLGHERFHHCMVEYMNRWKGKHPQPHDFFYTWNDASGENLNWFWKPWFFDWGFPDLAVGSVDTDGIVIENRGTMPMTVSGTIEFTDGTSERFMRSAEVWKSGNLSITIPYPTRKTVKKVALDDPHVSDTIRENNVWER